MSKVKPLLFLRAVLPGIIVVGALAGCQKEASLDQAPHVVAGQELVFEAVLEQEGNGTKTIRDDKAVIYWLPGDDISLFYGSGSEGGNRFVALAEEQTLTTNFSGTIGVVTGGADIDEEDTWFWGLYPYDPAASCDAKTVTMAIPAEQVGQADTFGPGMAPSLAHARGLMLSFRNIWSGFGFTVSEAGYSMLKFRGNNGEKLAGRAKIGVNADNIPYVDEIVEGVTEVTLMAPTGEGFIPGKYYYMQFFPQTLASGFTVDLYSSSIIGTWVYGKSMTFKRSEWNRAKNADTRFTSTKERSITPADIEDANFAAYLFANFDENQDNVLSVEERNKVETISVHTANIVSGQGVEFFPNLQRLEIRGGWNDATNRWEQGSLATLNVSYNTKLKYINCSQNYLTELDLSNNPLLTQLNCSENQLTSLDVTKNTRLTSLEFNDNSITAIDLTKTPLLEDLSCAYNQIRTLDVSIFPNLRALNCGYNPLTSFDISANTKLTSLDCGGLSLTSLDVSHLSQLSYLNCGNNPLTTLDVKSNSRLRNLYCYDCGLTSLDVTECPLLRDLGCEYNQFVTLDVSGCPSLRYLYALSNPMTTLYIYEGQTIQDEYLPEGVTKVVKAVESMAIDETAFPDAHFRAYVSENLDTNGDGELTKAEMLSVTSITVCTDEVASLEGIGYFKNLSSLNCYGSKYDWDTQTASGQLTSLDFSQNTALQWISCRNNQLTALDVSMLPELQSLNCSYNYISSLDLSQNPELSSLNCYNIQLTALDVSHNSQLQNLQCQNNQLTTLDVSHNGLLEGLYCSSNNLSSLDVSNNPMLQWLDMGWNNQIRSIDLTQCTNLQSLSCGGTQLTALDLRAFTHLTYLYCEDCSNLETVFLPEGLEELANNAFAYCYALKEINLPRSLKRIGNSAIRNCTSLKSIDIPASVTYIGRYAFYYCTALTRVAVHATTRPEGGDYMFHNTNDCPIGVPESVVEDYKAAPYWVNYASRIFALGSGDNEDVGYNEW